jgi:outer membrane DcaP-like protein/porin-like protein
MTKTHAIGTFAAIGSLTATIALLTGLPAASADELADLRANQELLQRRIEQLAQGRDPNVPRGGGVPGAYGAEAVPGVPLSGGSFPRSFLIPGTDTSIRVGGQITEVLDYWLQNGPINGIQSTTLSTNGNLQGQSLDIHGQQVPGLGAPAVAVVGRPGFGAPPAQLNHSRGSGIFLQSPRESRLNVETRTPTAWGESRTFLEFDMAGCTSFSCQTLTHVGDNLAFRFRYGYATLGGFLAGQANSNFADPDANGEVLDFGGPIGQAGLVRVPQLRYTIAGPWGSAWSASIETPETDIMTPVGPIFQDTTGTGAGSQTTPAALTTAFGFFSNVYGPVAAGTSFGANPTKNVAPDVALASYWAQPWGHVDFKLVGRDLTVTDGRFFAKSYFGFGGSISGDVKPGWFGWNKDDFTWQATAGNGIGRYLNDQTNAALATNYLTAPTSQAQANSILFHPISAFGMQFGYQHWWLPNLRSNVNYGFAYYDVSTNLVGPSASMTVNKQLQTVHINVIWSPVAFIDTGVEYVWGQRKVLANIYGTQQALVGKFQVKF